MGIKKTTQNNTQEQMIQLVEGEFTPSEASDIIVSLINQKINYHKLERLQFWERNHKDDKENLSHRVKELEKEREIAKDFISKMRDEGRNLKVDGVIKITACE
jgi:hypothetical protein